MTTINFFSIQIENNKILIVYIYIENIIANKIEMVIIHRIICPYGNFLKLEK